MCVDTRVSIRESISVFSPQNCMPSELHALRGRGRSVRQHVQSQIHLLVHVSILLEVSCLCSSLWRQTQRLAFCFTEWVLLPMSGQQACTAATVASLKARDLFFPQTSPSPSIISVVWWPWLFTVPFFSKTERSSLNSDLTNGGKLKMLF